MKSKPEIHQGRLASCWRPEHCRSRGYNSPHFSYAAGVHLAFCLCWHFVGFKDKLGVADYLQNKDWLFRVIWNHLYMNLKLKNKKFKSRINPFFLKRHVLVMFTNIPKTNNKHRFISEKECGGDVSSLKANHRRWSQERNGHPGSNSCLEVEGKFVLSFPEVMRLPALFCCFFSDYKLQRQDGCTDCCRACAPAS